MRKKIKVIRFKGKKEHILSCFLANDLTDPKKIENSCMSSFLFWRKKLIFAFNESSDFVHFRTSLGQCESMSRFEKINYIFLFQNAVSSSKKVKQIRRAINNHIHLLCVCVLIDHKRSYSLTEKNDLEKSVVRCAFLKIIKKSSKRCFKFYLSNFLYMWTVYSPSTIAICKLLLQIVDIKQTI